MAKQSSRLGAESENTTSDASPAATAATSIVATAGTASTVSTTTATNIVATAAMTAGTDPASSDAVPATNSASSKNDISPNISASVCASTSSYSTTAVFDAVADSPTSIFPSTRCWPLAHQHTQHCVSLEMRSGDRLCFAGQTIVEVIEGSIACHGAILRPSSGLVGDTMKNIT